MNMLKYRLKVLENIVDKFILVESSYTFSGNKKDLYYAKLLETDLEFANKYKNKIIHVIVNDMPNTKNPWDNEWHQRNCINRGLETVEHDPNDLILISDCDEIPRPSLVEKLQQDAYSQNNKRYFTLHQDMYYYDINHFISDNCAAAKAVYWDKYCEIYGGKTPQLCREDREHKCEIITGAGWHLSYFGDMKFISNKIKNFSHQELNIPEHTDINILENRKNNHIEVFGYSTPVLKFIPIEENTNLPPFTELLPHQILDE